MGWSAEFLLALLKPRNQPRFILETVEDVAFKPASGFAMSSHVLPGYVPGLGYVGNRVTASIVTIGEWTATISECVMSYRGAIELRRSVTRGQLLVLRVGWPGWAAGDYEPVFYGHVSSIDRSGDEWSITMRSVVSSLTSRMTQEIDEAALFALLGETTLTAAYDGGVDTTVDVVDASDAEKEGGAGGRYFLQIYPTDGDPFFVSAGGKTGTSFTSVDTTALLGTTAADADIDARVLYGALIIDAPVRAAHRILVSTGLGTNGIMDTLPYSWGVGIPYFILDDDDLDRTNDVVNPPGLAPPTWHVWSIESQADGLSWLTQVLAPAGLFLCERQGLVTIRCASPANVSEYSGTELTDADIIAVERQVAWDTGSPVEYGYVGGTNAFSVVNPDGGWLPGDVSQSEVLESRPAVDARYVHLPYLQDDVTDWTQSIIDRVAPWSTRIPETVEILCRGLRLAMYTPGDTITINSRHYIPRDRATLPTLMLLSVSPDWWAGTVRIVAGYHPSSASEF